MIGPVTCQIRQGGVWKTRVGALRPGLLHAEKVAVRALVGLSRVTARVVPRSSYVGKMDMYMHLGIGLTRLDALAAFLRARSPSQGPVL